MQYTNIVTHAAGVTLNRSLYETVLRELLLERAEHTVELYEGSGAAWRKVRYVSYSERQQVSTVNVCNMSAVWCCILFILAALQWSALFSNIYECTHSAS